MDAAERVAGLLRSIWAGNRAAMARDVGVSHTAINRVVNGQRPPGRSLLTAISGHPKVNPGWLLTGEGEPLLAERKDTGAGGGNVPVAKRPLPGPPGEHADLLSGDSFPVAHPFYRATQYWLEIQPKDPVVRDASQRIMPNDLLLLDTDTAMLNDLAVGDTRLCVVRVSGKTETKHKLGLLLLEREEEEGGDVLSVDTFDSGVRPSDVECDLIIHLGPGSLVQARRVAGSA